ncbi:hypothetical protein [uncultured Alsobacter sp.]|nr:hypothetical protein [uncultured Alsobacter sp.]
MIDQVTLSGGDLGGEVVEGEGWAEGERRDFNGFLYERRGDQAVFVGMAP